MSSESGITNVNTGVGQKSEKQNRKKRQRSEARSLHSDREAVHSVVSAEAFMKIEQLRAEFLASEDCEELFWRLAREQMVRSAQRRPNAAATIMRAKVGAVGAFLGLPPADIARLVQQVDLPSFAAAAAANLSIQEFQKEPQFQHLWTYQAISTNPPLRVEFEHSTVFASINEAGDIAKSKSWGRLLAIKPLRTEDRLAPRNITYVLKATSKLRLRWEVRDTFKNILTRRRGLVTEALRSTKKWFLKTLSASDAKLLRDQLDLTPDEFWRMVRHGEKLGPDGIVSFVRTLEEKTKGYTLPFPEHTLVQIQPAPSPSANVPADCDSAA